MKRKIFGKQKFYLKEKVWEKASYFKTARKLHLESYDNHPGISKLRSTAVKSRTVLDCGCGDGTILELSFNKGSFFVGVDISNKGCELGRRRFLKEKNVYFVTEDVERLGFKSRTFDFVYSIYTLEHLDEPEKALKEMIRVLKKNGNLLIVCPNYGSPFYPSPCIRGGTNRMVIRALTILVRSGFFLLQKSRRYLHWTRVRARVLDGDIWEVDWDATCEPYLLTLLQFLRHCGIEIIEYSSGLGWEDGSVKASELRSSLTSQLLRLVRISCESMGKLGVAPFKYFGPAVFILGRKRKNYNRLSF